MTVLVPNCVKSRRIAQRGGGMLRLVVLVALLVPFVDTTETGLCEDSLVVPV